MPGDLDRTDLTTDAMGNVQGALYRRQPEPLGGTTVRRHRQPVRPVTPPCP
jgi:hypothetical protein